MSTVRSALFRFGEVLSMTIVMGACSSTTLSLNTVPEQARVIVKPLGSGSVKELGQTPLNISAGDIEKDYGGSGPLLVEFFKEGYLQKSVLITDMSSKNINLKVTLDALTGLDDPAEMNSQIETLFEAQRLVRVRRYEEALKLVEKIKAKIPTLSSPYELEGGIYYISRRFPESLDAYRKAVKLNPRSVEAVRMRDMLERTLGGGNNSSMRMPASEPILGSATAQEGLESSPSIAQPESGASTDAGDASSEGAATSEGGQ